MVPTTGAQRAHGASPKEWVLWFVILGAVTAVLLAARDRLNQAHVTLAYLIVVQFGSARGGRTLGVALALTAFLLFDVLFLPPYGTLIIRDPLNWLVLVAFLATSLLSAQLLYRAQAEAQVARLRADEIDRLATLGAETLGVARAEEAVARIVSVIRSTLPIDECGVYIAGDDAAASRLLSGSSIHGDLHASATLEQIIDWVVKRGRSAVEHLDGTTRVDVDANDAVIGEGPHSPAHTVLRPLQVRDRTVGVLLVGQTHGLALDAPQVRVLDALAYYAALAVERVRLLADAEHVEALEQAHRTKDAVLASVSHDLRTPLTTIKGVAHEIVMAGDARARIIEEEADRLNAFVAKLLDLSRITSGAAVTDVQPNDIGDLLGTAAQQAAGAVAQHRLDVRVDESRGELVGRFDFAQTLRALVNLLENAAKYSAPGSRIELSADRDGPSIRIVVADRGSGIAPAERDRVFEPFYRVPGQSAAGAGLGLSIARAIAEAQGGSLQFASRPDGGSLFMLRVPAVPEGHSLQDVPA